MIKISTETERFYSSIAQNYSSIFPFNPSQLAFTEKEFGPVAGKHFMDVGCATGEFAFNLAEKGAKVTAVDFNRDLLEQAKVRNSHELITYQWTNMLHIVRLYGRAKFDAVTCYGNTLVHLLNPMQMRDFFSAVHTVLKPGGAFYLQILNYDYIFQDKVEILPVIDNEKVKFERRYQFVPGSKEIRFFTTLTIKSTGEVIENETDLLGISSSDLVLLMDIAGLLKIKLFGGFDSSPFGGKHLPMVISSVSK